MIDFLVVNFGCVINLKCVMYLVLDEVDCMFDMGFELQVMKIFNNVRLDRQIILFLVIMFCIIDVLMKKVFWDLVEIMVGGCSVVVFEIIQVVEIIDEFKKFVCLLEFFGELYVDDDDVCVLIFVEC